MLQRDYIMFFRVGHGYDVHKLVLGRKFVLFGEDIDFEKGLLGHSDADVGIHAVIDSLLGAAGLGDIGTYFPDNDEKFKDIDSTVLLEKTYEIIKNNDYVINNIDCTVILESPKINQHIDKMRKNICNILHLSDDGFNVKATTEEGLGFTGSQQGVAVHAVALLSKTRNVKSDE